MRLSDAGKALIKRFEGLSLKAYPDTLKGWSIGYGHFGAQPGQVITQAEADRLFDLDVRRFEDAVNRITPNTTQEQFDAFTSLAYNIGPGRWDSRTQAWDGGFGASTTARRHNAGDTYGAADAMLWWNKSDGAVNPVLEARRERERAVYLHGNYTGPIDGAPAGAQPAPAAPAPLPPVAAEGGKSMLLAGVGLVFFCRHCSRRSESVRVEPKP